MILSLTIGGSLLLLVALVWCALILWSFNLRWFYLYLGLMAATVLGALTATRGTYLQALLIPIGILAFSQLPLLAFRKPKNGWIPFALMVLASLSLGLVFGLEDRLPDSSWIERAAFTFQLVGIFPLVASWLLVMEAGWKVGRWWGIGLNPITLSAVLPVFVVRHSEKGQQPAIRFLFWLTVTFAVAFVDSAIRDGDPLVPVGLALGALGMGVLVGALVWLLVSVLQTVVTSWRIPSQVAKARIALMYHDTLTAAKAPALLAVVGTIVSLGAMVAYGDLVTDRHPMARDRSWFDVLSGCGWSAQLGAVLRDRSTISKEERLASFELTPLRGAASAARNVQDYDPDIAVALAKAAALVYARPSTLQQIARRWGFADDQIAFVGFGSIQAGSSSTRPEKPGADQVLMLANDMYIVIAFRGTDQLADWGTNLDFLPKNWRTPEWQHHGFAGALSRLQHDLLKALKQLRNAKQQVWLTGHSLGGALAVLAATPVSEAIGDRVQGIYTFAQPKVAGESLTQGLADRAQAYYRFVLHRDEVPGLGTPYSRHAGQLRYIDSLGVIRTNDHWTVTVKDAGCSPLGIIEAHGMMHYMTALELKVQRSSKSAKPS